MREQLAELPRLLFAHLELSLFALLAGVVISVPLGILASRSRWLGRAVMGLAAALQTMPSLAPLALMVPLLGVLGLPNIGFLPAFLALVLYSVFPILRNTLVGLSTLDPAMIEAARAVGMSPGEQLLRVELPLALPVIVTGIRTATVWTVGAATLATPVGADSLGNYIFTGLQTRNFDAVLVGCVASAVLALSLDALGRLVMTGVQARRRGAWLVGLGLCASLYLGTAAAAASKLNRPSGDVVIVGAKTFAEQYILSEALTQYIQRTTGVPAVAKQSLGSSVLFDALKTGAIDVYVDYSGAIWTTVMKRSEPSPSRDALLTRIRRYLRAEHGIEVVATLGFENTYALAMQRKASESLKIGRIGDLAAQASKLSIAGDYEFFRRPEWQTLTERYQLAFAGTRPMDASLMYQAVTRGAVDVIAAFSTDGRLAANDLIVLSDDRHAIPPYDAIVLVGPRLVKTRPGVVSRLRALQGRIDGQLMRELNRAALEPGRTPAAIGTKLATGWIEGKVR